MSFNKKYLFTALAAIFILALPMSAIVIHAVSESANWCYNFQKDLKYGDQGPDVTALITALKKENIYVGNGAADYFNSTVEAGAIEFQEKYASEILTPWGLTSGTGYVGSLTRTKLNQLYGCQNDNLLGYTTSSKIVLIIVNDYIKNQIIDGLNQYAIDLKNEFSLTTRIETVSENPRWQDVRDKIYSYPIESLEGVLFVGNIPSIKLYNPAYYIATTAYSDNFYAELSNTLCPYDAAKDAFNVANSDPWEDCLYTSNFLRKQHPFWMARITPPHTKCIDSTSSNPFFYGNPQHTVWYYDCLRPEQKLGASDVDKIKDYFRRNHEYRMSQGSAYSEKTLCYIQDSLLGEAGIEELKNRQLQDINIFTPGLYQSSNLVYSDGSVNNWGRQFLQDLKENYELLLVNAHGSSRKHDYYIFGENLEQVGPAIIMLKSCSTGNHTAYNNIAASYLFKGGLLVSANTVPVSANSRIPQLMVNILAGAYTYSQMQSWKGYYPESEILFGDPTLKMRYDKLPQHGSRPVLTILDKEVNVDLRGKEEIAVSVRIKNDGGSNLLFYPLPIMYTYDSSRTARGEARFSFDPLLPNQEKTLNFFFTKKPGLTADGLDVAMVRFITNDLEQMVSGEIKFNIMVGEAPTSTPICTDTDGGRNYYEKGTTYGINPNNNLFMEWGLTDYCNFDYVREYSCKDDKYIEMWTGNGYTCPYGCEDGACKQAVALPSPVLQLNFDDGSGQYVYDASSNSKYGILGASSAVGSDDPTWQSGAACKSGSCLSFDGLNDTVTVSNIPVNTQSASKNTVAFWMYWKGKNGVMPFGWRTTYDLWLNSNAFGFNTGLGNIEGISNTSFLKNSWHHIVAVFSNDVPNSNNVALWIDGVKQTITHQFGRDPASRTVTSRFNISGWGPNNLYRFDGLIDEFRLYNVGLSEAQIRQLYNSQLALSSEDIPQSSLSNSPKDFKGSTTQIKEIYEQVASVAQTVNLLSEKLKEMMGR